MARVDVIMPQMGESIAEGTVSRWLKQVGDEVKRDEPILEISTDKVDAEIPSRRRGSWPKSRCRRARRWRCRRWWPCWRRTPRPRPAPTPSRNPRPRPRRPRPPRPLSPLRPRNPRPPRPPPPAPPAPSAAARTAPTPPAPAAPATTADERLKQRSTPLVRKMAAEHDIDISQVPGSGHAGRVTKKDLLAFIESGQTTTAAPTAAVRPGAAPAASGPIVHPTVEAWPGDRVEPMSKIRKLTADHMIMSRRTSAHVTSFYEIDFTRIANLRRARKAEYEQRGGRLTYMSFIFKTVADNLRRHPVLNASVSGDSIIYRNAINVGMAVALDWGLIVPVIKQADELSVLGLAKTVVDLAERARTKKLNPDEVQNGTFTVTNPGVFGSYIGTPIINQPQVAILGVGAIEKRPKVITLDDGQDVIAIRMMSMFSLSYDHRVVDGADADRFMADLKKDLENFPEGAL